MPGKNIFVRKKKWNTNDMAAVINNVEQNGIDIREAARRYEMSEEHNLAA